MSNLKLSNYVPKDTAAVCFIGEQQKELIITFGL
jgi:hypothetical protein